VTYSIEICPLLGSQEPSRYQSFETVLGDVSLLGSGVDG